MNPTTETWTTLDTVDARRRGEVIYDFAKNELHRIADMIPVQEGTLNGFPCMRGLIERLAQVYSFNLGYDLTISAPTTENAVRQVVSEIEKVTGNMKLGSASGMIQAAVRLRTVHNMTERYGVGGRDSDILHRPKSSGRMSAVSLDEEMIKSWGRSVILLLRSRDCYLNQPPKDVCAAARLREEASKADIVWQQCSDGSLPINEFREITKNEDDI